MKIISHRGYWKKQKEKNSKKSFQRSFSLKFGTETDIRDSNSKLVISHDIPEGNKILFTEFLDNFIKYTNYSELPLALNIKSDGLAPTLSKTLIKYPEIDYFFFDMSIPDMKTYIDNQLPVFTRVSDVEINPIWVDQVDGIWVDSFYDDWIDEKDIQVLLNYNKRICFVSPELHSRDQLKLWKILKKFKDYKNLILCTDFPEMAYNYITKA